VHIGAFIFALLIVQCTGAISSRSINSMAGCFYPLWICIFRIRPPAKPPDKTEPINLRYQSPQLIVFCGAMIANASRHQLIVKSNANPASYKIIVESEYTFVNQIHSELPTFYVFKIAPTDPSKAMTATAPRNFLPIGTFQQTLDSATSTTTIVKLQAPSVLPTVDHSVFDGKRITESLTLFASASPVPNNKIERERASNTKSAQRINIMATMDQREGPILQHQSFNLPQIFHHKFARENPITN